MNFNTDGQSSHGSVNMWMKFLVLLKTSRPLLWIALPLVFCMGLAYGQQGLTNHSFRFTPLIIIQMCMLSFPICLFIFGLNDVYDYISDQMNPRKNGLEGIRLETRYHRMVKIAAFWIGIVFLCFSAATTNLTNIHFTVTILCLSYVYSVPPWRLKSRPPFDVVSAGILGFFAPFALGYSFVDDATSIPFQAYYFTCCVMGFHAFSTIMDYDVDKRSGDRTFAVAYGKRAAALFPTVIFLCSMFFVHVNYIKIFFMACLIMFIVVAVFPSERIARFSFLAMFTSAIAILSVWILSLCYNTQ
jgi:4-hydroxybenzoate polyprenyltransferase